MELTLKKTSAPIVLEKSRFAGLKFCFVLLVTLSSCRFWSFHGFPDRLYDVLEALLAVVMIVYCVYNYYSIKHSFSQFKINVWLFILLPMLSSLTAAIFHNQSPVLSLFILRTNLFWLLYYVLHVFNLPVKKIIGMMVFVGLVWVVITVVQQFTYPKFIFYNRDGEDGQEFLRAGVYRFMIDPYHFGLFVVLFFYYKYLVTKRLGYLAFVLVGLTGFYYFGTRQVALAAIACMAISSFFLEGKTKYYAALLIILVLGALLINKEALFGGYIDMTNNQLDSNDDVRIHSAKFFLFDYWPHWLTVLFGNGMEHDNSDYGKEMLRINANLGYFRSDVGIIGTLNYFGLFYVINVFATNIKGLRNKYYSTSNKYLKLFFINALMLIPLADFSYYPGAIPFFCFIFYLVDKSYEEKLYEYFKIHANSEVLASV